MPELHGEHPHSSAKRFLMNGVAVLTLTACAGIPSEESKGNASAGSGAAITPGSPSMSAAGGPVASPAVPRESASEQLNQVICGPACSITLSGAGAAAQILGTAVELRGVSDGRASLLVEGRELSCAEGEGVSSGSLTLQCTRVSDRSVTFDAMSR